MVMGLLRGRRREPDRTARRYAAPGTTGLAAQSLWLITTDHTHFIGQTPDVRKRQLQDLGSLLAACLRATLVGEGLAVDCLGGLDAERLKLARTADRSVVGFMNDMAFQAQSAFDAAGGLPALDVAGLNARLNRTPYNRGGYVFAIDHARFRQDST